jgi:hypothetical protein
MDGLYVKFPTVDIRPWLVARFPLQRPELKPKPGHVGFVMDKAALVQLRLVLSKGTNTVVILSFMFSYLLLGSTALRSIGLLKNRRQFSCTAIRVCLHDSDSI